MVVIGGGVTGCSVAYHLTKLSDKKVVLLERDKVTSGTTWHSAAQVRQLRSSQNLTDLIRYSAKLYSELEGETGQSTGWLQTGSISIATNADRLTHIRRQAVLSEAFGIPAQEITARQVQDAWPLANVSDIIGAVFSPNDGRVNPSDLCAAFIKGFRKNGGNLFEDTPVTGLRRQGRRLVGVDTAKGAIRCDTVVLCGGLWSAAIADLAGVKAPLHACEHFYLLTKPIDGISRHLPTLSDHDGHLYIRDEGGGILLGCFEPRGKPIGVSELPENFAFGLLNEDWDHFEPMMHNGIHRIPALETAEVRMLLNGPESFTPDGAFLLGPSAEVDNLFMLCGMNSVGVASGGGAGRALSEWIIEDEAPMDLVGVDPRRFAAVESGIAFLRERTPEVLGEHYAVSYPGSEWSTGRNLRELPLQQFHVGDGARFGQRFGFERPLAFGSCDMDRTYRKPAWFSQVASEVEAAHSRVAVFDQSTFGKIAVSGRDAERFLQDICANDVARKAGRVIYSAILDERGRYQSDVTLQRLAQDSYVMYVNTNALYRDLAWLHRRNAEYEVTIADCTEDYAVIGLMGPRARETLQIAGSGEAQFDEFPYFTHKAVRIGSISARAARLSYVGTPGWELTVPSGDAPALYRTLRDAGKAFDIRPAGLLAQTSMRIEKGYLSFGHDVTPDDTPIEANQMHAVKLDKDIPFVGREALLRITGVGKPGRVMRTIRLHDREANPIGGEPIRIGSRIVGRVTSAAFGFRVGRPVCLGYVRADPVDAKAVEVEVDIASERFAGTATLEAAYDPEGTQLRSLPGATA